MQPTPVFSPGESHGHSSLVGYSPCGPKESDTTEGQTVLGLPHCPERLVGYYCLWGHRVGHA